VLAHRSVIANLHNLLLALLGGNTVVFLDGRFDPGQVLEDPTRPGRDLASVRSSSLGGSPVTPEFSGRLRAASRPSRAASPPCTG